MMTFSELDAQVLDLLGINYSIEVELVSRENGYPACKHLPKVKRTLGWKIWDGKEFYEGATAEEALAALRAAYKPEPDAVSSEALKAVDVEKVEAEF